MNSKTESKSHLKTSQIQNQTFDGLFPGPHGLYYRESPQAREQKAAEQRAQRQAKYERFRASCEKCRQLLANPEVCAYWLAQARPIIETEKTWQGPEPNGGVNLRYAWPRDKGMIYSVMLITVEAGSNIKILSENFLQTVFFKTNKHIGNCIENFDLAAEFLSYIEGDLREQGLWPIEARGLQQAGQELIGTSGKVGTKTEPQNIEGEWSKPMKKITMINALRMDGYKSFNTFAKQHGIQQAGNRQLWQIRLDTMDKTSRKKLEK